MANISTSIDMYRQALRVMNSVYSLPPKEYGIMISGKRKKRNNNLRRKHNGKI